MPCQHSGGIRGWIHISIDSPRLVKQSQCSADPPRYAAQGGYFKCCMHLLMARADANCEDEDTRPSRPLRAAMGKAVPGWIFWYNLMWKLIQGESTVHPDIIWHATTWKRSHGQWPRDSLMKACLCECVADEPSVEQQLPEDDRRCLGTHSLWVCTERWRNAASSLCCFQRKFVGLRAADPVTKCANKHSEFITTDNLLVFDDDFFRRWHRIKL